MFPVQGSARDSIAPWGKPQVATRRLNNAWHKSWHDARIRAVTYAHLQDLFLRYCLVIMEALLGFTKNRPDRILKRGQ